MSEPSAPAPTPALRRPLGNEVAGVSGGHWLNGDVPCPNDGEPTNKRCWKCGWVRSAAPAPTPQAQQETRCAHDERVHYEGWRCADCAMPCGPPEPSDPIRATAWMRDAGCAGINVDTFFADMGGAGEGKRVTANDVTITGYACACWNGETWVSPSSSVSLLARPVTATTGHADLSDISAVAPPTTASVVLDPFGGTGTVALVAKALGRHGISVDLSADYCRLAEWRTTDRGELAKAMRVPKPDPVSDDQLEMFA